LFEKLNEDLLEYTRFAKNIISNEL